MKRRNVIILMISLSLVLLLGSSYALLRSSQVGSNPYVINVGTLQVTFEEGKTEKLNLENMYPMSDKEGISQSDELGFTVKNTGTVASYYDVYIEETSTTPEFKSVIRFISNKDNQGYNEPKTLSEDKNIDVGGYLKANESSSYKVKIWLDYNADNTYMDKTFTAKVLVNSFQESKYAKDVIKSKLVKYSESSKENFEGGLIAVNTDGDLYNETIASETIREYRYSGLTVNNYVTFNDETWRIIGVFPDEVGQEHIKIVRNEILSGIFPESYKINEITYKIKGDSENYTYKNYITGTYSDNSDWATAGLQYWLNTKSDADGINKGYLNYLSEDNFNMIEETKYYLGAVTANHEGSIVLIDTPKDAYKYERAVGGCEANKGSTENNSAIQIESNATCRVWVNNNATWKGKIALLYLSDYGYSANSKYWETSLGLNSFDKDPVNTTWLSKPINISINEWLLSPTTHTTNTYTTSLVSRWNMSGFGSTRSVFYADSVLRPCVYLKSNVKITSGDGTFENPYDLTY